MVIIDCHNDHNSHLFIILFIIAYMYILKGYGINTGSNINNYDALNDKHASSYFYAKSVKKQLKKLKKV